MTADHTSAVVEQKDDSIDAVVAFDAIAALGSDPAALDRYTAEVARVLKHGCAFVFFERGEQLLLLRLAPGKKRHSP